MNKQTILALDLETHRLDPSPALSGRPEPSQNGQHLCVVVPDLA